MIRAKAAHSIPYLELYSCIPIKVDRLSEESSSDSRLSGLSVKRSEDMYIPILCMYDLPEIRELVTDESEYKTTLPYGGFP